MVSNIDNSENGKLTFYKPTVESTRGCLGDEKKKNCEDRNAHYHGHSKERGQENLYECKEL